jgi:hypothetical protein
MDVCLRLFCVCVALCVGRGHLRDYYSCKESYRLCENKYYEAEQNVRAQQTAVDPLMNKMNEILT